MQQMDFEAALNAALERKFSAGRKTPRNLAESIRYSLLSPGKRIRPRLTLGCGEMIGLAREPALCAAIALEMIHCFTLIHDDLPCMDDDDLRRGRPTNHRVYGEAMALLAGDALVGLALDVFSDAAEHAPPACFVRALRTFCDAIGPRGVIGGQASEMLLDTNSTLDDLRKMHEGKTGALFLASLVLPVEFAGLDPATPQVRAIHEFASEIGFAFQVADDLADAAQDQGAPMSILAYLPATEASQLAQSGLSKACQGLEAHWGSAPSQILREIAAQVLRTLHA